MRIGIVSWCLSFSICVLTSVPGSCADEESLAELQQRVTALASKLQPRVVSVSGGSGVFISKEGLILSQAHVSHFGSERRGKRLVRIRRKPGDEVDVVMFNGKRKKARLLGYDGALDLSLLQMVDPGPYPFASPEVEERPEVGEWVLKLGHPTGYKKGRPPVVRLGRTVFIGQVWGIADCLITGGDSGGPYFDLSGNFVGLVNGLPHIPRDMQVPPRHGRTHTFVLPGAIRDRLADMRAGRVDPFPRSVDEQQVNADFEAGKSAGPKGWTQSTVNLARWETVALRTRGGVVEILRDQRTVALGTIVDDEGWVLTKASRISSNPKVRTVAGPVLEARVVGVEPAFDVALLKVDGLESAQPNWTETKDTAIGTLLVAPSSQGEPIATGIVSAPARDVPGPHPTEVAMAPKRMSPALPPEVIGSPVQGRGYWIDYVEGNAKAGGLKPGDLLISIGGYPVRRHIDLVRSVADRQSGEIATLKIQRGNRIMELRTELPGAEGRSSADYGQRFSFRRDGFPTIFECDVPLRPEECGGPLVGIDGEILGISIARIGPHGCAAIPAHVLQSLLGELKAGNPLDSLPQPPAPAKQPVREVSTTIQELKDALTARAEIMNSLLVEYDLMTEAHAAPQQLAQWGMHQVRDYSERHLVGYSGQYQFSRIERPEFQVFYTPLDQIHPPANAPKHVKQKVDKMRQRMMAERASGGLGHLWGRNPPSHLVQQSIYDGNVCLKGTSSADMSPAPASTFYSPVMYLANILLRPLPPDPRTELRVTQRMLRLPSAFDHYKKTTIQPEMERVDGAECIVLEARWERTLLGTTVSIRDRIMFDPHVGYAPRRWEQFWNGKLRSVRVNEDFDQYIDGYWLPRKCTWTRYPPDWVKEPHRNRPAYSYRMQLLRVRCGDAAREAILQKAKTAGDR